MTRLFNLDDFDECECGDYRHQHEDGTGACNISWGHRHVGICKSFRLFKVATEIPEAYKDYEDNKATPEICQACAGSGKSYHGAFPCPACSGTGAKQIKRS